jgi:hypothetical protein
VKDQRGGGLRSQSTVLGRVSPRAEDVGTAVERVDVARQQPQPASDFLIDQVRVAGVEAHGTLRLFTATTARVSSSL